MSPNGFRCGKGLNCRHGMQYRHFTGRLETTPPLPFWETPYRYVTRPTALSSHSNWASESRNRLSARLHLVPLEEVTVLPRLTSCQPMNLGRESWDREGTRCEGKVREGGKVKRGKSKERKGKRWGWRTRFNTSTSLFHFQPWSLSIVIYAGHTASAIDTRCTVNPVCVCVASPQLVGSVARCRWGNGG